MLLWFIDARVAVKKRKAMARKSIVSVV